MEITSTKDASADTKNVSSKTTTEVPQMEKTDVQIIPFGTIKVSSKFSPELIIEEINKNVKVQKDGMNKEGTILYFYAILSYQRHNASLEIIKTEDGDYLVYMNEFGINRDLVSMSWFYVHLIAPIIHIFDDPKIQSTMLIQYERLNYAQQEIIKRKQHESDKKDIEATIRMVIVEIGKNVDIINSAISMLENRNSFELMNSALVKNLSFIISVLFDEETELEVSRGILFMLSRMSIADNDPSISHYKCESKGVQYQGKVAYQMKIASEEFHHHFSKYDKSFALCCTQFRFDKPLICELID